MNTTIAVEVIKGVPTPWPRIESDTAIMSVGWPARWRTRSGSASTTSSPGPPS